LGNGVAGPNEGYATSSHSTVVGTLRARGGVAFDRVFVFGTGGLALTDLRHTLATNSGFADSRHQTTGWVGGGGAEVRIAPRISLVAMALYTDFGTSTLNGGDGTSGFTATVKTHYVTGSLGLSMLF
jgi:outer membrane immunogenic protein